MSATRSSGPPGPTARLQVSTPAEVLLADEVQRTKVFATFVLLLTLSAEVTLFFTRGDPDIKIFHRVGVALGFLGALRTLWLLRRPGDYKPRDGVIFGLFCVIAIDSGYPYWGELSAEVLLVPIGIYFFALGQSFLGTLGLLALVMVPHLALNVLISAGMLEDRSLFRSPSVDPFDRTAGAILVQAIIATAFFLARNLRSASLRSVERLERAVRGLAQREALLAEARAELDQVARVGGPGRYTEQVVGRYRLGIVIGRGAMGEVYEAHHVDTGEPVAAKLLHPRSLADSQVVARFLREVKIAQSLEVANVVRVVEVPTPDSPMPYLLMERLYGESLGELLRSQPRPDRALVIDMLEQVGRGIAAAHRAGIVHRDLKPHNLFRHHPAGAHPTWKVLDFGVSKLVDQGGTLTQGLVVGTPGYMSPEQARGDEADHRADLYSLSVILYRALTGRPAFSGGDVPALLYAVVHDMPPRPSAIAPLPEAFDEALAIGMAKEPADRFASAEELVGAFTAAHRGALPDELHLHSLALMAARPWAK